MLSLQNNYFEAVTVELLHVEGVQAEPHGKEKETHELVFSWLSWVAVLLVGLYDAVAQDGGHTLPCCKQAWVDWKPNPYP